MMMEPRDDFPHPVPPQAFMTWKENWVFPGFDPQQRIATLFHFSLRPALGEGVFTAKLSGLGWKHSYLGRNPVPPDLTTFVPVSDDRIAFEVVEPGERFHMTYRSDGLDADLDYAARFAVFDFADGPKPRGESPLGPVGLSVFPFHHYEQALAVSGSVLLKDGELAGTELDINGWGNRDHSWGWRDDFQFRHHHWVCASFDDLYVQGSVMLENYYPEEKHGGFVSTSAGNTATEHVDTSDTYWVTGSNERLGALDRDVRYRITTVDGKSYTVVAHIGSDFGRHWLNARSQDRSRAYEDCQIFCDYTLEETGQRGSGVLEVGTSLEGPGIADSLGPPRP
jgi:hypothetical protein